MIVSVNNNNTSFKARNAEIRFADDLARRVNKAYPRISATLVGDSKHIRSFQGLYKRLCYRIDMLRDIVKLRSTRERDGVSCLRSMVDFIKQNKLGNCTESATLSSIALEANGIKGAYPAVLQTERGYDLDHAVVLVPNNGKPYVVDSWLGFADYVPKAFERYQKEFRHHFNLCGTGKMVLKRAKISELYPLQGVNQKHLKKAFPELL